MSRPDNRRPDQMRPIRLERYPFAAAPGSVLIAAGDTTLLCTASIEDDVPPWKAKKEDFTGWVTAQYAMLPGSTSPRKRRGTDGRSSEIQRLIGRSLRSVVDFTALGARTVTIDCDVLRADGGTRTLAVTGGFVALADALTSLGLAETVLTGQTAAVSTGIVDGEPLLDLNYAEDSRAEVDLNVIMNGQGALIECQGTAEHQAFTRQQLDEMLDLAETGIGTLLERQRELLANR